MSGNDREVTGWRPRAVNGKSEGTNPPVGGSAVQPAGQSSDRPDAICPLNGEICPGVVRCAPAVFLAQAENAIGDPEIHGAAVPQCPVLRLIRSLEVFTGTMIGREEKEEDDEGLTDRQKVLRELEIDQGG